MLIIDLALIVASNAVLLPFAGQHEWALWVGSALMGVGVSSIYPTLWSFLEVILPVTSKMTSVVNAFACLGEFIGKPSGQFFQQSFQIRSSFLLLTKTSACDNRTLH